MSRWSASLGFMTTVFSELQTCAVCHEVSAFQVLGSTSIVGSYDLDLRAPPLQRHTMALWLQDCPHCGYVNCSIKDLIPGAQEVVRSPEFHDLRQDWRTPELISAFKRHALIVSTDPVKAGWSLLHAAWVCDDLAHRDLAREYREACADFWVGADWTAGEQGVRNQTVLVDVFRRATCFDEADALIERLWPLSAMTAGMARVLRFQKLLITREDADSYTCEHAFAAIPADNLIARH